jgi:hypothetical protein
MVYCSSTRRRIGALLARPQGTRAPRSSWRFRLIPLHPHQPRGTGASAEAPVFSCSLPSVLRALAVTRSTCQNGEVGPLVWPAYGLRSSLARQGRCCTATSTVTRTGRCRHCDPHWPWMAGPLLLLASTAFFSVYALRSSPALESRCCDGAGGLGEIVHERVAILSGL